MTTIGDAGDPSAAVQSLFDGLMRFSRSIRSRSGDWGHVALDLSRGDIVTLGVIARAGRTRPGQIASTLCVDPSVVSRQLATLDRLGLIERGTDPRDRRAELVGVTSQGLDRLHAAREAMCDALAVRLSGWDAETIARAATVLGDLADLLGDTPATPDNDSTTTATSKEAHA